MWRNMFKWRIFRVSLATCYIAEKKKFNEPPPWCQELEDLCWRDLPAGSEPVSGKASTCLSRSPPHRCRRHEGPSWRTSPLVPHLRRTSSAQPSCPARPSASAGAAACYRIAQFARPSWASWTCAPGSRNTRACDWQPKQRRSSAWLAR